MSALIIRDSNALTASFSEAALKLKDDAIDAAAQILRVTNAAEQEQAVEAQKPLDELKRAVEKARVEAVSPFVKAQKQINAQAKAFAEELGDESFRLARQIGDYQQLELARVRAEEAAQRAELAKAEREREAKLAEAKTHEAREVIQEEFCQEQTKLPPPPPARVVGQTVKSEWQVRISNIAALYLHAPDCVELKPRLSAIKDRLEAGETLPGVIAEKVVLSRTRATTRKAIEV